MSRATHNDGLGPADGAETKSRRRSRVCVFRIRRSGGSVESRGRAAIRGFTLVEVAMSVVVLALALTTALAAMQRAFLQFDTVRNLEVAGNILQCEMEKERLFDWTRINDPAYQPVIDPSFARNPAIGGRFTLSRTVAALPDRNGKMVQITLTIRWRSYDGRSLSRTHTTYYTEGGLHAYLHQP